MGDLGGERQAGGPGTLEHDLDLLRWAHEAVRTRPDLARRYLSGPGSGPALV